MIVKFKRVGLNKDIEFPKEGYENDAGIDLKCAKKIKIAGGGVKGVNTGIAVEIPEGYYGQLYDKSGFALNNTLSVKAGVIDSGYRGEIVVIMANTGPYPIEVEEGMKIAQMVIHPIPKVKLKEVDELTDSERGEKGFGSTGEK